MTDERDDRSDDGFEAFLERHAGEYNRPPETPREAMWEAIEARRRKGRDATEDVIPLGGRRRARWVGWAAAAAAILILGIGLGRLSLHEDGDRTAATGPAPDAAPGTDLALDAPDAVDDVPGADPRGTAADPRAPALARRARDGRDAGDASGARDLYRLASTQMLARAEAILVQYRADRRAERLDPAIGRWAKDVLSSTRLLLDSPAADDPRMRSLLEDLELVLAQIVHVAGVAVPDGEAAWLDRTIEDRDMIPRLRMAIPEGDARPVGL